MLRLLKGDAIDAVSCDTQVPAHELEEWRRVFLESGTHGSKKRIDPEDRELRRVQADSPFHGEGHRKMRVRLRALGHRSAIRLGAKARAGLNAVSRSATYRCDSTLGRCSFELLWT